MKLQLALAFAVPLALAVPSLAHAQEGPPLMPPIPQATAPNMAPVNPARAVWVHLHSDRPVMLEAIGPDETRWRRICVAPCDAEVSLDDVYRVAGPGILASRGIELEASPGERVVLDVNAKTYDDHKTGERLTIAGWVVAGVGLALEVGALSINSDSSAEPVLLWSGVGAAGAAVALAISSYIMLQPTGVSQSVQAAPVTNAPRAGEPWTRLPVWREAAPAGAARATTIPLFSTSF
jgi:hypothetical protein